MFPMFPEAEGRGDGFSRDIEGGRENQNKFLDVKKYHTGLTAC